MPGLDQVGSALMITLALLGVSITVVAGLMWWLFKVFRNKDERAKEEQ